MKESFKNCRVHVRIDQSFRPPRVSTDKKKRRAYYPYRPCNKYIDYTSRLYKWFIASPENRWTSITKQSRFHSNYFPFANGTNENSDLTQSPDGIYSRRIFVRTGRVIPGGINFRKFHLLERCTVATKSIGTLDFPVSRNWRRSNRDNFVKKYNTII